MALLVVGSYVRLIPAYAGSTDRYHDRRPSPRAHPHLRGEHTDPGANFPWDVGSSPLTQGAPCHSSYCYGPLGLIPAYAGSTVQRWGTSRCTPAHPRLRGEHSVLNAHPLTDCGSSPLTRGALTVFQRLRHSTGLIPAYAGSTSSTISAVRASAAHPRLRGEHERASSVARMGGGLIPAYAGSTTDTAGATVIPGAHPRLRGEHGNLTVFATDNQGSSPLTRGALMRCLTVPHAPGSSPLTRGAPANIARRIDGVGLIPAYAGSTASRPGRIHQPWAHPRLRGEHDCSGAMSAVAAGSSPLTRGAHR